MLNSDLSKISFDDFKAAFTKIKTIRLDNFS